MKYIAITFDDGRSDNYLLAKQIMDKYQLKGTVYITTGFVDGTWQDKDVLKSPTRALTVDEIKKLYDSGWEIGLHGDKHQTSVDDMQNALYKLQSWGIENKYWSVSVPNSDANESEIAALYASGYGDEIAYIRRGRKCDTSKLSNKVLYVLYSVLKLKWAYRKFNFENSFTLDSIEKSNIPSVVVKSNDDPEMIIDFVKHTSDDSVVVLMLHSVLPREHFLCGKDPWSWEEKKFERLCSELKNLVKRGELEVSPLIEQLKG